MRARPCIHGIATHLGELGVEAEAEFQWLIDRSTNLARGMAYGRKVITCGQTFVPLTALRLELKIVQNSKT